MSIIWWFGLQRKKNTLFRTKSPLCKENDIFLTFTWSIFSKCTPMNLTRCIYYSRDPWGYVFSNLNLFFFSSVKMENNNLFSPLVKQFFFLMHFHSMSLCIINIKRYCYKIMRWIFKMLFSFNCYYCGKRLFVSLSESIGGYI